MHDKARASTTVVFLALLAVVMVPSRPTQAQQNKQTGARNPREPEQQEVAPSPLRTQSDEVKAFRKTAIPVSFPSHGLTLRGWLYKPEGNGPFPAIIWNHGSEKNPTAHPELGLFYTSHGDVLFLPVRHGHNPSPGDYIQDVIAAYKAKVNDQTLVAKKAVELQDDYNQDVVAALDWLKQQAFVDRSRIAVSGCSYGGIQTLLTAEKGLGVRAFVPFAPAAMSWANTGLQKRLIAAVRQAKAPLFLIQAQNDYSVGPSETLGPIIRKKGGLNRAKIYPAFGTTHAEGHGGFACWEKGIAMWGANVLAFLDEAGMSDPARRKHGPPARQ